MQWDYSKLRGKIVEVFRTVRSFSKALGQSETATYNYLNGRTSFDQKSIEKWCRLLDIPLEDAMPYFFTRKV